MRPNQLLWLSGPLVVRDIVAGVGGVTVAAVALIAGCAFASAGNLAWFAFLGLLGTSSLHASLPQLRRLSQLPASQPTNQIFRFR